MRRFAVGIAVLTSAMLACAAGCTGEKHHDVIVKYKAEVREPGKKSEEKKFDLANPAHEKDLTEAVRHGFVVELGEDKPPDLFGLERWDIGLWSIGIFIILFLLLARFAWKPMLEGLTKREEKIRDALEQAEKTRREALEQSEKLQMQMKESAGQVAAMMDEGRRDAQALKEQMVADAKAEIQQERDRLLREVEAAKDQALQEIWQSSVSLATAMSAKAIGRAVGEEDHRRLLDESLAELKSAGAGFGKRSLKGAGGI
jgi:F-type H+-transporting ATPase subunit b